MHSYANEKVRMIILHRNESKAVYWTWYDFKRDLEKVIGHPLLNQLWLEVKLYPLDVQVNRKLNTKEEPDPVKLELAGVDSGDLAV